MPGQAAGDDRADGPQPVRRTVRANPDLLDIDVWRLLDHLREATTVTDPVTHLIRAAVTAHTGNFAEGRDYDWIEPHREQLPRNGIRARLALAELLRSKDVAEAAALIIKAAELDPHNEDFA